MTVKTYQTMSKFCRINLESGNTSNETKNINVKHILSGIKHINDRPLKKITDNSVPEISQRLLGCPSSSLNTIKTRSRYLSRQKEIKKAPVVRKYEKQQNSLHEPPSAVQYTPNYEVCLPSAPKYIFPRAFHERMIDANFRTQSEMIKVWEKGPRTVKFGPKTKEQSEQEKESEEDQRQEADDEINQQLPPAPLQSIVPPPHNNTAPNPKVANTVQIKAKKQPTGLISMSSDRNSFIPKNDIPAPGQYQIKRLSVDKNRASSFDNQSTRKDIEIKTERTYFGLAKSIDSTKPQPPRCVPFKVQLSRHKENKQKDIWNEIEREQKQLYDILHPKEPIHVQEKKLIQPFSLQTTYFDKHPFQSFMGPEYTKDLVYDVDLSIKLSDKKIKPLNNFGRRTNDNDRAIYVQSEAPDIVYKNVNEEWKKTQKNSGTGPVFSTMHERRSPYDYMPKIDGGSYTAIKNNNWSYRTPALMDKMGEREMMMNLPPQYV